ncbi:MAG: hypothetical protein ACPG9K_07135, partial [Poseidonibacter sp.]
MYIIKLLLFSFLFFINTLLANTNLNLSNEEIQFIKNHPIIKVGVEKDGAPLDFRINSEHVGLS